MTQKVWTKRWGRFGLWSVPCAPHLPTHSSPCTPLPLPPARTTEQGYNAAMIAYGQTGTGGLSGGWVLWLRSMLVRCLPTSRTAASVSDPPSLMPKM